MKAPDSNHRLDGDSDEAELEMAKAFNAGGVREPESLDGSGWGEPHAGAGTSLFAEDGEQHRELRALQADDVAVSPQSAGGAEVAVVAELLLVRLGVRRPGVDIGRPTIA